MVTTVGTNVNVIRARPWRMTRLSPYLHGGPTTATRLNLVQTMPLIPQSTQNYGFQWKVVLQCQRTSHFNSWMMQSRRIGDTQAQRALQDMGFPREFYDSLPTAPWLCLLILASDSAEASVQLSS